MVRKNSLLFLGIVVLQFPLFACDLCSLYMNFEPNDLKNSFGMNFRQRTFESTVYSLSENNSGEKHAVNSISEDEVQKELYRSFDLWFNYFLNHDWQINVSISFSDNYFYRDDRIAYNVAGPGDLSVVFKRFVMNHKPIDSNSVSFRWLVGGGLKIPTGNFNKTHTVVPTIDSKGGPIQGLPREELDPHFQPGTGSLDFLFLTEFQFRYKKSGFSTNLSYRINTENSNHFRFANRFNANSSFFQLFNWKKIMIAPNFGLNYEFAQRDQLEGDDFPDSGGSTLFFNLGTKVYWGKFAFGVNYFDPLHQNLYDHQLLNKNRYTADVTFYI